jgi:hypothetical protein
VIDSGPVRGHGLLALVTACGFSPAEVTGNGAPPAIDAHVAAAPDAAGSGSAACPDADGDGVCDAVDDWPCGPKPTDLAANRGDITIQGTFGANNITTQSANTRLVVVHTNTPFALSFDYDLYVSCLFLTTCRAQLEIGTDKLGKSGCVFDADVTGNAIGVGETHQPWSSTLQYAVADVYQVRLMPVKAGSCTPNWAVFAPSTNDTIAIVCVHD